MILDSGRELDYLVGHNIYNVTLVKGTTEQQYSHTITDNGRWMMLENIARGPLRIPDKIGIGVGGYGPSGQTWLTEQCPPIPPTAADIGMRIALAYATCTVVVQNETDLVCTASFTNSSGATWHITEAGLLTDSNITLAALCLPMVGSSLPFSVASGETVAITWVLPI